MNGVCKHTFVNGTRRCTVGHLGYMTVTAAMVIRRGQDPAVDAVVDTLVDDGYKPNPTYNSYVGILCSWNNERVNAHEDVARLYERAAERIVS